MLQVVTTYNALPEGKTVDCNMFELNVELYKAPKGSVFGPNSCLFTPRKLQPFPGDIVF